MSEDTLVILLILGGVFVFLTALTIVLFHCLGAPATPAPDLLAAVRKAHEGTGWEYTSVETPPGQVVLAWRRSAGSWYGDRALDALLVRADGRVETVGVGVEFEVFGSKLQESRT